MPDIVTFDGPNRIITVIDDVGNLEMELDVVEIYSEWKVWVAANDAANSNFLPAFSFVGGDPISATQSLGITYFLENGWRIRPAEKDHKLTIIGNLFTREEGESVFLSTVGAFTVNTETRVSNLVDSSVSRLDLNQLLTQVYIDTANGEAGTDEGDGTQPAIGTPTRPSNNIADTFTIAQRDNLSKIHVRGNITLDRPVSNFEFTSGGASPFVNSVNLNGHDVPGCTFTFLALTGPMGAGPLLGLSCVIAVVSDVDGAFRNCGLQTSFTIADNSECHFFDCGSLGSGAATPVVTMGANSNVSFQNYSGGLRVSSLTDGSELTMSMDPAHCILEADCTGGILHIRGTGNFTNYADPDAVTIYDIGLIEEVSAHAALLYRDATQQLDVSTWLERKGTPTTPTSMQLSLYELDGTLVLTVDETNPAMTLTAAGWYAGTVSVVLQPQSIYFAQIAVGDARGVITRTRAAVRA